MPVKFSYTEHGLRITAAEGGNLTEQEAMIVAVHDLGESMHLLAQSMSHFSDEFAAKDFYDEDVARSVAYAPRNATTKKKSRGRK